MGRKCEFNPLMLSKGWTMFTFPRLNGEYVPGPDPWALFNARYQEACQWCDQMTTSRWATGDHLYQRVFAFRNARDAMLYKLAWV